MSYRFEALVAGLVTLACLLTGSSLIAAEGDASQSMHIAIDARELPRKLVDAEITIPLIPSDKARSVPLWYPKWVPGSHGPGGPIANIGGLIIRDSQGNVLEWKRTPGEVYRFEVDVPPGVSRLHISVRYISNQPTTGSFGHDCWGSEHLGAISPSCLLLYPEGADIDKQKIATEIKLLDGWHVASALPTAEDAPRSTATSFAPVSLRTFVDSPLMFGQHYQSYELTEDTNVAPPHTLHVFADDEATALLNEGVINNYRKMVTQAALTIGSHPFDRFDILLGVTDALPKNGLEHSRSTFNILPPSSLRSPDALKGWDRLLVPHEYLHAWCGKYRRPAGMVTSDFHTPKDTELLWVYEGLTQYLGELVEARSGLMSDAEFRHRLAVELRAGIHQQGREWRTLADTGATAHILRDGSPNWGRLRRSQDFYMEGMLFWIEADAQIRRISEGKKSLDDFCKIFFKAARTNRGPIAYTRRDIVRDLGSIAKFDWDGLIARRIESFQSEFDPSVAKLLGYHFTIGDQPSSVPGSTFRSSQGLDFIDSIGMSLSNDGQVREVLIGSAADQARITAGQKIIGIDGFVWSGRRMIDAIRSTVNQKPISLLVQQGDRLVDVQIHYYEGPKYWSLERAEDKPDVLSEILKPLSQN